MKPKIYIETTTPSDLTAWLSRDLIRAAHQRITKYWWDSRRIEFDLSVSDVVMLEAAAGDPIAAAGRLEILGGIPVLKALPEALRPSVVASTSR